MPRPRTRLHRLAAALLALGVIPCTLSATLAVQDQGSAAAAGDAVDAAGEEQAASHLVISEVLTGAGSASDEFIEIYNPTPDAVGLAELEVVYVSATGVTITRKAAWSDEPPSIPPGAHLLLANAAGTYAGMADVTYSGGLSATGGSVALRVAAGEMAIDAVGWGSSVSTWLEGTPAPAADPGMSLERLPGGDAGSWRDTDDNAADFALRSEPNPEAAASAPIPVPTPGPGPTTSPTVVPTPTVLPSATPVPSPTPAQTMSITEARAAADGSIVTVVGSALTDATFADGGGYLVDETGGVAVLLTSGTFARGDLVQVTGTIGDRYAQRTIRADPGDVISLGPGSEPDPIAGGSGGIGEAVEARLVRVSGVLAGAPSSLSGGLAFELDDGSGAVRVFVMTTTGIDLAGWQAGVQLELVGVVGQRDSSGTGTAGYRLMPRDAADVLAVGGAPSPAPTGSTLPSASASGSPASTAGTVAAARAAARNARLVVRGVVTLQSGLTAPGSAAIADGTGAIFVRISDEAGQLALGELVELDAKRSTWTGMESLHVSLPPRRLGSGDLPAPLQRATGAIGEADEARLIEVSGTITSAPIRSSSGNVYFDLDDGSGPIRVFVSPRAGLATDAIGTGQRLTIRGVLLQETTGQQPTRGYRLWPRSAGDLDRLSEVPEPAGSGSATGGASAGGGVPGSGVQAPSSGGTAAPTGPARVEPLPVLRRPQATASAPAVVTAGRQPPVPDGEPGGATPTLVLLGAAGGLLILTATTLARRTLSALAAGALSSSSPALDASGPESVSLLVPVEVATTLGAPPTAVASIEHGGSVEERRILPPT